MPKLKVQISKIIALAVLFALLGAGSVAYANWTPPTLNGQPFPPPDCPSVVLGCNSPINVSGVEQTKTGNLTVGDNSLTKTLTILGRLISPWGHFTERIVVGNSNFAVSSLPIYAETTGAGPVADFRKNTAAGAFAKFTVTGGGTVGSIERNGGFSFRSSSGEPINIWHTALQPIIFGTANAERMRITPIGNVSIGNSSLNRLDVTGKIQATENIGAPSLCIGADCRSAWPSSGEGNGTVTSVGLAAANIFSVSGSPITNSGTLGLSLVSQAARTVFAGPASGASASPSFRTLTAADIPITQKGSITAGTGITVSNGTARVFDSSSSVSIAVNTNNIQTRVLGTCAVGSSIRVINQDGTVTCESDNTGTGGVTNVIGSSPIIVTSSGSDKDVSLASCTTTNPILKWSGTAWACGTDNNTGTTYTAGTGIDISANVISNTAPNATHTGDVTGSAALTIANSAVTTVKLADNSVISTKIADGAVTAVDIANNAVTSAKILDANVTPTKLAPCTTTNPILKWSSAGGWICAPDDAGSGGDGVVESVAVTGAANKTITLGRSGSLSDLTAAFSDIDTNTTYTAGAGLTLSGTQFSHAAHTGDVTGTAALTIANSAVTTVKLADNSVISTKIADGAVTAVDIANNAVTSAKIANKNVTLAKLADCTIAGQILKWNGTAWACGTESGGLQGSGLTANYLSKWDGTSLVNSFVHDETEGIGDRTVFNNSIFVGAYSYLNASVGIGTTNVSGAKLTVNGDTAILGNISANRLALINGAIIANGADGIYLTGLPQQSSLPGQMLLVSDASGMVRRMNPDVLVASLPTISWREYVGLLQQRTGTDSCSVKVDDLLYTAGFGGASPDYPSLAEACNTNLIQNTSSISYQNLIKHLQIKAGKSACTLRPLPTTGAVENKDYAFLPNTGTWSAYVTVDCF